MRIATERTVVVSLTLFCLSITSVGCDNLGGIALESALEQTSDVSLPDSAFANLKAEQATCPRQIDEHTVLTDVSLQGINRVRYTYVVSESGRPEVNMIHTGKIRTETLERARSSHLGPSIAKQQLAVDHFFEDSDGKCLLWLEMSGKDYEQLDFVDPNTIQANTVSFRPQPSEEDRERMLAQLAEEQAKCPRQINSHTSLKSITLKGDNRLKYLYVVTKDGLKDVNMDTEAEVRQQILDRSSSTPLGESIVNLDMGVEHFFQSMDGQCMLWIHMTRSDYAGDSSSPETTADPDSELSLTPPEQLESYIPEVKSPFGGPAKSSEVQSNPFVK